MSNLFQVSVIIPVYNAEKFLRNAVESAVQLEEVKEIILVEDASPDNALLICKELEKEYSKIKLFRHPNGENRGAGASRNLGIENSTCNFIAFLDADDWYLPNRFEAERDLLINPEVDGVYGPTGRYFENTKKYDTNVTSIKKKVKPDELLYYILTMQDSFHGNAITVKKELLFECGLFDEKLKLHQDTHLWYKLAFLGKLYAGEIKEPIAIRREHDENRIAKKDLNSKAMFHKAVYKDFKEIPDLPKRIKRIFFNRYIHSLSRNKSGIYNQYLFHIVKNPSLIKLFLK